MLIYDISSYKSFNDCSRWYRELMETAGDPNLVVMLIGNKCDLEATREVSRDVAEKFAKENDCHFLEVSALDSTNIESSFHELMEGMSLGIVSTILLPVQVFHLTPKQPSPDPLPLRF
jgi:GTPase SAR1 family protein